jgi:hypothetical protein
MIISLLVIPNHESPASPLELVGSATSCHKRLKILNDFPSNRITADVTKA